MNRLLGAPMGLIYFKRYRMEIELTGPLFSRPGLPDGYSFLAWHPSLLELHAETKYQSFRLEIDANVFPCLGESEGCLRLMREIARRDSFLPEATWLLRYEREGLPPEYCGTIQGIRDRSGWGAIQNLGVTPPHRGVGLGRHLLHQALSGFCRGGLSRAFLEVTAQNTGAIRLYQRLGFRTAKTVYKAGEVAYA